MALSTGVPKSQVREVKGGSHMLLLDHPEGVAEAIRHFIRAHSPIAE
jgi:pimeloyl-ACP methyl ester carboxylesterase